RGRPPETNGERNLYMLWSILLVAFLAAWAFRSVSPAHAFDGSPPAKAFDTSSCDWTAAPVNPLPLSLAPASDLELNPLDDPSRGSAIHSDGCDDPAMAAAYAEIRQNEPGIEPRRLGKENETRKESGNGVLHDRPKRPDASVAGATTHVAKR